MSVPDAAGVSATKPLHDEKHRSGPDFQFLSTFPLEGTMTVHITGTDNPGAITAKMKERLDGERDRTIADISDGSTLKGDLVRSGDQKYYIADPSGATQTFIVYFTH